MIFGKAGKFWVTFKTVIWNPRKFYYSMINDEDQRNFGHQYKAIDLNGCTNRTPVKELV